MDYSKGAIEQDFYPIDLTRQCPIIRRKPDNGADVVSVEAVHGLRCPCKSQNQASCSNLIFCGQYCDASVFVWYGPRSTEAA